MGGKGRRRRERNWLAAHGGISRLPSPPKVKELEALPSKLRRIMEFKNPNTSIPGPPRSLGEARREKKKGGDAGGKTNSEDMHSSAGLNFEKGDKIKKAASAKHIKSKDSNTHASSDGVGTGKRKRKTVQDLRFQNLDEGAVHLQRKERKKEYLKTRKKKQKKEKMDSVLDFPGREEIAFGEVVEAPPKLAFPKISLDASAERIRLQAIEGYRKRRGWVERPGIKLPTLSETPSS